MKFRSVLFFLVCVQGGLTGEILHFGVTEAEKKKILELHNNGRKQVATGSLENQPRGINLLRMKYDETIAEKAQEIANTTVYGHVSVRDKRWSVGQNIYMSMSTGAGSKSPNWESAVAAWFDEHSHYNYSQCCSGSAGHYTQMVWAETEYVGCGYSYFIKAGDTYPYQKYYVCNYGPGGNIMGYYPYEVEQSESKDFL